MCDNNLSDIEINKEMKLGSTEEIIGFGEKIINKRKSVPQNTPSIPQQKNISMPTIQGSSSINYLFGFVPFLTVQSDTIKLIILAVIAIVILYILTTPRNKDKDNDIQNKNVQKQYLPPNGYDPSRMQNIQNRQIIPPEKRNVQIDQNEQNALPPIQAS